MKRILFHRLVVSSALAVITAAFVCPSNEALAQGRQLTLADILIALRSKKAVTDEKNQILTEAVKERGITFTLTSEIEKELGNTGAQPVLIAAIREKNPAPKLEKRTEPTNTVATVKPPQPEAVTKPVPPPPDFAFYRAKASDALKTNDLEAALTNLAKAAELKPADPSTFIERGLIEMRRERYEAAVDHFVRAVELDPKDGSSHFTLGIMREKLGQISEAIASFDKAAELNPADDRAKNASARLKKDQSDAIAAANKAAQIENSPVEQPPVTNAAEPATPSKAISVAYLNDYATRLVKPLYPPMERRAGVQGTVRALIGLDAQGKITSIKQVDGPKTLWAATEYAIRSSTFKPVTIDGKPVAASGMIVYNFKL